MLQVVRKEVVHFLGLLSKIKIFSLLLRHESDVRIYQLNACYEHLRIRLIIYRYSL